MNPALRLNEKAAAAMSVADEGKIKPACDRIVAASRYVSYSAAAVITTKIDGGNVQNLPLLIS